MITPCAIYFSTGRAVEKEGDRFFHICIPDQNYYEYVLVSDTKVSIPDHLDYQKTKEANIRLTRKGFVQELAKGSDAAAP